MDAGRIDCPEWARPPQARTHARGVPRMAEVAEHACLAWRVTKEGGR